ncbi:MAG TPA: dihydroorotate dehydrogenase-like protein [Bacteroidetes bacterium]|nr:dihydroorotate dehydrogenase-like protein [Bacteroidota bacterium]
MNITTTYMGLELKNPLIVSSSRLTGEIKSIRQCIEAGAGAIVLKSLFEEQIRLDAESKIRNAKDSDIYFWFPEAKEHVVGLSVEASLDNYLDFVGSVKNESDIPVISSINCITHEGWPDFAAAIQQAGADALELNIAIFPFNDLQSSSGIEEKYVEIVKEVKKHVTIPVSVKLGYYFTNLYAMAEKLVKNGVDGLVLFNRYFRPDINTDTMEVITDNYLSSPLEATVPMRWIALMSGRKLDVDLVASTGVHDYRGVVKQILAGARAVQLCSTLYLNGIEVIPTIEAGLKRWMEDNHFESLDDFRGISLEKQTTDASFERVQYMKRDYE